jgi:hypothetical protein
VSGQSIGHVVGMTCVAITLFQGTVGDRLPG